jgi:hypothetical protein
MGLSKPLASVLCTALQTVKERIHASIDSNIMPL